MDKLKITHIGKYYPPYRGGLESSLFNIVEALRGNCRSQVLVSNTRRETVIERNNGALIVRLPCFGSVFSQPISPALLTCFKRIKTDVIHLHLPNPLAVIFYLAAKPRARLIVSYHSDIVRQRFLSKAIEPFIFRILQKAEKIVVTSSNLIDSSLILSRFREKCFVIPHGIDPEKFALNPYVKGKSEKIKEFFSKPIILFVGRLVYYKGLKYLIEAMKNIDAHLVIVGAGQLEKSLKALADSLGVSKKVSWPGEVSEKDLPAYYHSCDIFVLPSCANSEAFGSVILEAQSCAKPVVTSTLPTGVTFVNIDQKTGLTVPPGNTAALAKAINLLLASHRLRQEYGAAGRKRLEQEFTADIMAERFLNLYGIKR